MEDFFFTGPLDYLLYEAELAQGSRKPITLDIRRRPVETPGETTWTGFGFKQVFEGSDITFRIPAIYRYSESLHAEIQGVLFWDIKSKVQL